jgi:2-polyprenyl-3-methyl-5-hydroxy-6-metoxy-1,4-benzoquinol methylase
MLETLEEIPCNICSSRDTRTFIDMGGYRYSKCRQCGLVYQNPRPVFNDLRRRYASNYFDYEFSNQENFFNLMKLGLRDIGFETLFHGNPRDKKFLDIGCATGLLLSHMKKKGWDARGVEICRESAEYGIRRLGLDIFIGTLHEAAFPDDYFDAVHFSHVIEHVVDPRELLCEVKRVVKRNGHIIITTPNVGGLQARCARADWRSAIPDHIYLFSKKTLGMLLELTGFRVVKQVSWGGIPIGKRPTFIKRPADLLAKLLNVGDVMLFHCIPMKG